jgi:hypothetical protein
MVAEDRLKALEEEYLEFQDEMKQILLDIRTYVMEATTPIPNDLEREGFSFSKES